MPKRLGTGLIAAGVAAALVASHSVSLGAVGDYATLTAIHQEFQTIRRPTITVGVPEYSSAGLSAQRNALRQLRARLDAIDPHSWPVPQQVDYLLVRANMDALDFDHRIMRPWSRDPALYLDAVRRTPFADVPVPADKLAALRDNLRSVPAVLDMARRNLTEPAGELTRIALFHLEHSDGVNEDEPRRVIDYPEGTIGWYQDLVARLQKSQPDLVADARQALNAVVAYRDWLRGIEPRAMGSTAIGLAEFNWYVQHVRLMPYAASDMRTISSVEFARARTFLKIEENRNRSVPPVTLAANADEHERRLRDAEALIKTFTKEQRLLTIPDNLPPFPTDAFWRIRPDGHHHFWEQLTYRDPLDNHIHASIPGHLFDGGLRASTRTPFGARSRTARASKGGDSISRRCTCRPASSTSGRTRASCSTSRNLPAPRGFPPSPRCRRASSRCSRLWTT